MAEQLMKKLEDDLTCSICQERFKSPKVLPCMHTYCQGCLETYANKHGGKEISCPTCRRGCKLPEGVKGLPANFYFVSLGEDLDLLKNREPSGQSPASCGMCNESQSKPEVFCTEYNFGICSKCKVYHSRIPQTSQHDLIPFERGALTRVSAVVKEAKVSTCTLHAPEKLRFFCKTCSQLICRECIRVQHKEPHQVVEATTEFQNVKTKLAGLMQSSELQLRKTTQYVEDGKAGKGNIEKESGKLRAEIGARYDNVLASFEKQLKGHLERERKTTSDAEQLKVAMVESSVRQAESWVKSMKCTQDLAAKVVEEANGYKVLGMSKDLFSSFNNLQRESDGFTWEKSCLEMGMTLLPEEIPCVEFGTCLAADAKDLVAVAYNTISNDGFILCRLDKTKRQITLSQVNRNGQVYQSNCVEIAELTPEADKLVVKIDENRRNVLVGLREWLIIFKFSRMDQIHTIQKMYTILKMRPIARSKIAAMCIVNYQSLVLLYEDDRQSLHLCNDARTLEQYQWTSSSAKINLALEAQNYKRHGEIQTISLTHHVKTITAVPHSSVDALLCTTLGRNNKIVVIILRTRNEIELTLPKPKNQANAEIIDIFYGQSIRGTGSFPGYHPTVAGGVLPKLEVTCTVLWGSKVALSSEKWSYFITEYESDRDINYQTWRVPPESGRPQSCEPIGDLRFRQTQGSNSLKCYDDSGNVFTCTQYWG